MRKRAIEALRTTTYTEGFEPAICALADFAAQNAGLEFGNYGDRAAYAQEARDIGNDWKRFKLALQAASDARVTDADVIAAAPTAFSGRLTWRPKQHTPATVQAGEASREGDWSYCTGQYFPTEYRKAAATLLEYATRAVKQARPPAARSVFTIADLRALNEENGGCWFDKGSMRFFGTKIESGILTGRYFITSEQPPHGSRGFTVRTFDEKGNIGTEGELCGHATRAQARKAAQAAHEANVTDTKAAKDQGAKLHQNGDTGKWVCLDMKDTPLWTASFKTEADAARAYLEFIGKAVAA